MEQLDVVYEDCIEIQEATPGGITVIRVEFNPTVPHCSLATLIGLCIRVKLERHLLALFKLDIYIKEGAHSTEQESKTCITCCIVLIITSGAVTVKFHVDLIFKKTIIFSQQTNQ